MVSLDLYFLKCNAKYKQKNFTPHYNISDCGNWWTTFLVCDGTEPKSIVCSVPDIREEIILHQTIQGFSARFQKHLSPASFTVAIVEIDKTGKARRAFLESYRKLSFVKEMVEKLTKSASGKTNELLLPALLKGKLLMFCYFILMS